MSRKLTYDHAIFGATVLVLLVGLVMIYSASALIALQKTGEDNPYYFLMRQCIWLVAGATLMFAVMHVDMRLLRDSRLVYTLLGAICAALILVLFQSPINGTHRWFVLSSLRFQPSEFAKPVLVLFIASYLAHRESRINELSSTLLPLLSVVFTITGLILLQPDFGTAATILAVAAGMIFLAGVSWQRIILFSVVLVPALIAFMVKAEYRRDRLLSFLAPEADPLGKGFQAMQSLIALGTGGTTGLGIGNGKQKLFFLPEPHTDFIFSIIGEELGFVGALGVFATFGVLVWRGLSVARATTDRFTFYAAAGFTLLIAMQVLVNISVTLCLLPTKGLPLPLVSYGGSSLVTSLVAIGILLNCSQQSS